MVSNRIALRGVRGDRSARRARAHLRTMWRSASFPRAGASPASSPSLGYASDADGAAEEAAAWYYDRRLWQRMKQIAIGKATVGYVNCPGGGRARGALRPARRHVHCVPHAARPAGSPAHPVTPRLTEPSSKRVWYAGAAPVGTSGGRRRARSAAGAAACARGTGGCAGPPPPPVGPAPGGRRRRQRRRHPGRHGRHLTVMSTPVDRRIIPSSPDDGDRRTAAPPSRIPGVFGVLMQD